MNDCNFVGSSALENGGGIRLRPDNLIHITGCEFTGGSAENGGALYIDPNCTGIVSESVLVRNIANEDGGAIYYTECNDLTISDCNIAYNTAVRGGGLYTMHSPESIISNCNIKHNEAARISYYLEYYTPNPFDPNGPPIPGGDPNDPNTIIVLREDRSGIAQGGGIYSFAGPKLIADSEISYNLANTSGGGIYFAGGEYEQTDLHNCLVNDNSAGRDGAGISTNWQQELRISNCTIANNTLTWIVSYGGGLYGSYESNTEVIDSIIMRNTGMKGSQIAVCSGDEAYPLPSNFKVSYSDVGLGIIGAAGVIDPDALPVIRSGFDDYFLPGNDDLSTGLVNIGFPVNYFGATTTTLYVNNNGNVTFNWPLWAFTPFGLTTSINTSIIAPFFADVDTTRGSVVTYGTGTVNGHQAFAANWVDVGYFFWNIDKTNSFQMVLIDRSDRASGDFDIELNYERISWESGDASGGINGFGGFSARAGFSNGTGNPGTFYEFEGSGVPGYFLDNSPTGLIRGSRNSDVSGRYIFSVRNGVLDIALGIPIYVEDGCTLEGWDPYDANNPLDPNDPDGPWDANLVNIFDDPNFIPGPLGNYYLSQIDAGYLQLVDSNCVDAGSDLAGTLGMDRRTTRTDLVPDDPNSLVDLGYHYPLDGLEHKLTVIVDGQGTVQVDPNELDPNNLLFDPNNNVYTYKYYRGNTFLLTATPAEGYRVGSWNGTNDDPSWNRNTNMVTMDSDKVVRVVFELDVTHNLLVPSEFATIEEAIADAGYGGTNIVVDRGTHTVSNSAGIDFRGKKITLMSTNPNDPEVIAATIIDCQGSRYSPKRAFHFHSGEDPNTVVIGLTIKNGFMTGPIGAPGVYGILTPDPYIRTGGDADDPPIAEQGDGASGNGYGGAILCENASSPTIKNCVITDNVVTAAWGGDGADGQWLGGANTDWSYLPPEIDADIQQSGDGQWGGDGGTGSGTGYGGAIACLGGSSPIIDGCTIQNNMARGGCGGNGGDGGSRNGGHESYGGNGGNAEGDGVGGGIYCENDSTPLIIDGNFIGNVATTGIVGEGGLKGEGDALDPPASDGYIGYAYSYGGIAGGAMYYSNSDVNLAGCRFVGNGAYETHRYQYGYSYYDAIFDEVYPQETKIQTKGGAFYSDSGNSVIFKNCNFTDNVGGAVHIESKCVVDFNDCLFRGNELSEQYQEYDPYSYYYGYGYYSYYYYYPYYYYPYGYGQYEYYGGAMYIGPECNDVDIRNCGFHGNRASGDGGALKFESDARLTNCIFGGNEAGSNGGAIDAYFDYEAYYYRTYYSGSQMPYYDPYGYYYPYYYPYYYGYTYYYTGPDFDANDPNIITTLNLDIESCSFVENKATQGLDGWGGAIHFQDFNALFTDCYFIGNQAKNGGGLFLSVGTFDMLGGMMSNNTATGGSGINTAAGFDMVGKFGVSRSADMRQGIDMGGGIVCARAQARIENYIISDNVVEGVNGSGGAISFYGNPGGVTHLLKNCLLSGNSATVEGGAIACSIFTTPEIRNCTFSDNNAGAIGGAIYCDWSSDPTIIDSIFESCNSAAITEEDFGNAIITHSLFHNNSGGDYGIYDSVSRQTNTYSGADINVTNIVGDPLFESGPLGEYYLGQLSSPAVDNGSDMALSLGLHTRTTSNSDIGDINDLGIVDIGYHYRNHMMLGQFVLTSTVIGGHGTVEPVSETYYEGTLAALTTVPETGYRVNRWTGTANDVSKEPNNIVVMLSDRDVTVEYDQRQTIVVGSRPEYTSIQRAIDAAEDGDIVILPTGTYTPPYPYAGIQIVDKGITLTSANPDDPNCVNATILNNYFIYVSSTRSRAVIDGLNIRYGSLDIYYSSPIVRNCIFNECRSWGGNGGNIGGIDDDGQNGGSVRGGAMQILNGSPLIQNCTFTGCSVASGDGGPGDNGTPAHPIGYDGGWAGWAYGGAVYCGFNSSPVFEDCSFTNCYARGGNGGDGGNGFQGSQGGRGGSWEWAPSI